MLTTWTDPDETTADYFGDVDATEATDRDYSTHLTEDTNQ